MNNKLETKDFNNLIASALTGVMIENKNKGIVERASSHLQPRFGITTSARATSKHAPKAQKH